MRGSCSNGSRKVLREEDRAEYGESRSGQVLKSNHISLWDHQTVVFVSTKYTRVGPIPSQDEAKGRSVSRTAGGEGGTCAIGRSFPMALGRRD